MFAKKIIILLVVVISPSIYGLKHCKGCLGSKWDAEIKKAQEQKEAELEEKGEDSSEQINQNPENKGIESEAAIVVQEIAKAAHEVATAEQEKRLIETSNSVDVTNDGAREDRGEVQGEVALSEEEKYQHSSVTVSQPTVDNAPHNNGYGVSVPKLQQSQQEVALGELPEVVQQRSEGNHLLQLAEKKVQQDKSGTKGNDGVTSEEDAQNTQDALSSDKQITLQNILKKIKRATPKSTMGRVGVAASVVTGMPALVLGLLKTSAWFKRIVSPSSLGSSVLGAGSVSGGLSSVSPDIPSVPSQVPPADIGIPPHDQVPQASEQSAVGAGASGRSQDSQPTAGGPSSDPSVDTQDFDAIARALDENTRRAAETAAPKVPAPKPATKMGERYPGDEENSVVQFSDRGRLALAEEKVEQLARQLELTKEQLEAEARARIEADMQAEAEKKLNAQNAREVINLKVENGQLTEKISGLQGATAHAGPHDTMPVEQRVDASEVARLKKQLEAKEKEKEQLLDEKEEEKDKRVLAERAKKEGAEWLRKRHLSLQGHVGNSQEDEAATQRKIEAELARRRAAELARQQQDAESEQS